MHNLGVQKIGNKETVEEYALGSDDHEFHEGSGLAHGHECQEMHSFVVAFFQERLNPAIVALHAAETPQVAKHAAHHAWNSSNAFEENESDELFCTPNVS
jgi:uncharacterized protein (DUF2267 family)